MLAACKTASAARVTAVIPCFPYARQSDVPHHTRLAYYHKLAKKLADEDDEKDEDSEQDEETMRREAVEAGLLWESGIGAKMLWSAAVQKNADQEAVPMHQPTGTYRQWTARPGTLIANMLTCAGAEHIITMDLHDPQFQGFFDIPLDLVYAEPTILSYIKQNIPDWRKAVIVSPDAGGAKRATSVASNLNLDFALIHRERNVDSHMAIIGNVKGLPAIIIDDIADTCLTLANAAEILNQHGASTVYAIVTHGMLSGHAVDVLNRSHIRQLVVTNTIPNVESEKVRVIDVAGTFAESIRRCHYGESVSNLFRD